jgi:hypothetical protein
MGSDILNAGAGLKTESLSENLSLVVAGSVAVKSGGHLSGGHLKTLVQIGPVLD